MLRSTFGMILVATALSSTAALGHANDPLLPPCEPAPCPPARTVGCTPQRVIVQLEKPEVIIRAVHAPTECPPPPPVVCCKCACPKKSFFSKPAHSHTHAASHAAGPAMAATPVFFAPMVAMPVIATPMAFTGAAFAGQAPAGASTAAATTDLAGLEQRVIQLEQKLERLNKLSGEHSSLHEDASKKVEELAKQVQELTGLVKTIAINVNAMERRLPKP